MLFHITMIHAPESCPACDPQMMEEALVSAEKAESMAKELEIKVHFMVNEVVGHTIFALLETDSADALARFVGAIPFPQDIIAVPVEPLQEMVARAREMMKQQK